MEHRCSVNWHLKKCRKRKVGTNNGQSFVELYTSMPESEWLSTHLHLERVERLCVKVHREREKALKANPHAVFKVPTGVKDSPAWMAWDLFDQILGQRTMMALSPTERKMYSVEYAKADDSAGRGHIHSDTGAVSGAWLWARMLTGGDEDVGFEAIEELRTCFRLQMDQGQWSCPFTGQKGHMLQLWHYLAKRRSRGALESRLPKPVWGLRISRPQGVWNQVQSRQASAGHWHM